ncbi:hypothetical protein [Pantoea sp. BAV 3049]|uniref:hypothetical protein n=1 Tax=Pantoea sp. BAV 3049 TaxID=2654188 RepID=UPI00131A6C66|nr:hypothetical protein [Pantoea sp. BAV 3049]
MGSSFTEEFKDQKIQDLLEDYIALHKEIESVFASLKLGLEEIPAHFDSVLSKKMNQIIQSSKEIDQEIETEKSKIKEIGQTTKDKLTHEVIELITSLKTDQEKTHQIYQKQLESVANAAKPFSTVKAVLICIVCTLLVTTGLSGAFWYVAQQQKESSLRFYANGYMDMRTLTEKTINKLPKTQQEQAKAELSKLENREPE